MRLDFKFPAISGVDDRRGGQARNLRVGSWSDSWLRFIEVEALLENDELFEDTFDEVEAEAWASWRYRKSLGAEKWKLGACGK